MSKKSEYDFSMFQMVLLIITSVIFVILIWDALPLDYILKFVISPILVSFILLIEYLFSRYLSFFRAVDSARAAVMITMSVFIVFPFIIHVMHDVHERKYLVSYPPDNRIAIQVTYDIKWTRGKGSIGDDWVYRHFLNDVEFEDGEIIEINSDSVFSITSRFIEQDGVNDIGETTSRSLNYASDENYKRTIIISQMVHVVENGGRKNAGAFADFDVTYTLKRVVPSSMSYWAMFFYTPDSIIGYIVCHLLIVGEVLCLAAIAFVLVSGRKRMVAAEEQKTGQEMQDIKEISPKKKGEFQKERASFIEKLQGQSIRQVAGVPAYISFVDGLPKDNGKAKYGSFTVYRSDKGKCYHDRMGCCSAHRPTHFFVAKRLLKPCSKCCINCRTVPSWYVRYNELEKQAKYYQIEDVVKASTKMIEFPVQ